MSKWSQVDDRWQVVPTFSYSNETQVMSPLHKSAHSCTVFSSEVPSSFRPSQPPVPYAAYPSIVVCAEAWPGPSSRREAAAANRNPRAAVAEPTGDQRCLRR
jgi:hypothetical protein